MTQWIIEKSLGFTDFGLYRISESVRAHAYLILGSQASVRSSIVGNIASALTAQSAFLNNFENVVNRRVNIQEDIKHYQDTLSYTSSKVDYSMGENIYMLPSDMNLKIKMSTVRYNSKILVSDGKFSLGKNEKVNSLETPAMKSPQTAVTHRDSNEVQAHTPTITHKNQEPQTITQNEEKLLWYFFWQVALQYGICLDESSIKKVFPGRRFCMGHLLPRIKESQTSFIIITLTTCQFNN